MSDLYLTDKQSKKFPDRGDTDFLSPEENAFVQRILSRPESFPQAFWSAVIQKLALDGLLMPQSQVQGLPLLNRQVEQSLTDLDATTASLTNITNTLTNITQVWSAFGSDANTASTSPQAVPSTTISGLDNGTYLAQSVVYGRTSGSGTFNCVPQLNGSTLGAVWMQTTLTAQDNLSTIAVFSATAGAGANNIRLVFWHSSGAASAFVHAPILVVQRIA